MDKDRIKGSVEQATGAVKETVGKVAGDAKLEVEGWNEKAAGKALSHLARRGSLAAPYRLAKSLNLLNPSLAVRQVVSSKNG